MTAIRNPLMLSDEQLAKLDRDYPREGVHANIPEAHFEEWVKTFQRFEKRTLSEDELKLARYFWKMRGEDDYIAVERATFREGGVGKHVRDSALRAILRIANKQFFSRSDAVRHYRPFGSDHLNP